MATEELLSRCLCSSSSSKICLANAHFVLDLRDSLDLGAHPGATDGAAEAAAFSGPLEVPVRLSFSGTQGEKLHSSAPLGRCETAFGQHICQLLLRVDILHEDARIHSNSLEQPIQVHPERPENVSHRW